MNNQPKTIISDWGIEDYLPSSPRSGYFQPLRFISNSFLSHHSQTDSVNSIQSQYRHDSITDTTSSVDSPSVDNVSYKNFLDDYGMDKMLMINDETEDFRLLVVGRNFLSQERKLMGDVLDQFNYNIITSDLIRNDTKLTYLKPVPPMVSAQQLSLGTKWAQLARYSVRFKKPRFEITWLLISMIRHLIRHRSSLLIKLTVSILINYYSNIRLIGIRLKLFKMMKMLTSFMNSNFQIDNKIIGIMKLIREGQSKIMREEIAEKLGAVAVVAPRDISMQEYLIFKNGLSLLTINYNRIIRDLLPCMDASCLEKYLNVYKMDFSDNDMDFIWILNHSKLDTEDENLPVAQEDHVKRLVELEKLVKNYSIIRKFYLCCLLTMGELDMLNEDEFFFKELIETRFNIKFKQKDTCSSFDSKLSRIIESLKIEHFIKHLSEQLKNDMVLQQGDLQLMQLQQNTHDKLISRMEKIINNMRYLRYKGYELDRQTGQDLQNLVQLYSNSNRTLSNPVELKRYSMPTMPKQRILSQKQRNRDLTPSSKRLSSGLSFNLLTAVLEDNRDSQIVSFDDNYVKIGSNNVEKDETVIMHDIAHSTMLEIDTEEMPRFSRTNPDEQRQQQQIMIGDDGDEEFLLMSPEEMRLRLSSTFERVYK